MIDDLDKSIETLLVHELPAELADQVHISFEPPAADFPPSGVTLPAVDLFLYDVRENTELRNTDLMVERTSDGHATALPPPVRVDCSYLVTAWPSDSSPTPAEDEHRLLGEVMLVLLRHATLPEGVLQGTLQNEQLPLPTSTLQPPRLQSAGEFWQAMGGKPKATLSYTVTLAVQPATAADLGPVVTEKRLRFTRVAP
jgi:Pvc16 N-terminal domain